MIANLEPGLLWIEKRIRELSLEFGRPVDCMEWIQPTDAQYGQMMMAGIIPLKICRGGEFRIVEFQRKELLEVEGDPEVQRRIGERIQEGLRENVH